MKLLVRSSNLLMLWCAALAQWIAGAAVAAEPIVIHASKVIACRASEEERPAVVTGVSVTADGAAVAAATDDHRVMIWSADSAEMTGMFAGHSDWVRSVALSTDGRSLASGAGDRVLHLWDPAEGGQPIAEVPGCEGAIAAVAFHPNQQQIAVAGFSRGLRIVNTSTGQVSQQLACPCGDIRTIAFSRDGARMAVAGRNGKIRLWNVHTGAQERTIETDRRRIRSLAFSPDSRWLAAAGTSQEIRILDSATGELVMTLATRPAQVYSLTFLGNMRLATGGTDNRVLIWDLQSQTVLAQLVGHTGTVAALACDASGTMLVSGSYDTTLRVWHLSGGKASVTAARSSGETTR